MVEGINNKIKVLKRIAYGYRDVDYFQLRLYALHDQVITQKSRMNQKKNLLPNPLLRIFGRRFLVNHKYEGSKDNYILSSPKKQNNSV